MLESDTETRAKVSNILVNETTEVKYRLSNPYNPNPNAELANRFAAADFRSGI